MEVVRIIAHSVERSIDQARLSMRRAYGWPGPIRVMTYDGYGQEGGVARLRGRVLAGQPMLSAAREASVLENVVANTRRFLSREVPHAVVRLHLGRDIVDVETNDEGYYDVEVSTESLTPGKSDWRYYEAELLEPRIPTQSEYSSAGRCLVPSGARFGVISDIDDTIVPTGATRLLEMLRTTFAHNARTRLPFAGVAPFYRALRHQGAASNPFFYVSSSPWNLYDFLTALLRIHAIPAGPFLLNDFGLDSVKLIKPTHDQHKLGNIRQILKTYPDLDFVLIGDSGQRDPEIYEQVVREFPGRVRCIYIRDLDIAEREPSLRAITERVQGSGVVMMLAPTLAPCAEHAAGAGLVESQTVGEVRRAVESQRPAAEEDSSGRKLAVVVGCAAVAGAGALIWWMRRSRQTARTRRRFLK